MKKKTWKRKHGREGTEEKTQTEYIEEKAGKTRLTIQGMWFEDSDSEGGRGDHQGCRDWALWLVASPKPGDGRRKWFWSRNCGPRGLCGKESPKDLRVGERNCVERGGRWDCRRRSNPCSKRAKKGEGGCGAWSYCPRMSIGRQHPSTPCGKEPKKGSTVVEQDRTARWCRRDC